MKVKKHWELLLGVGHQCFLETGALVLRCRCGDPAVWRAGAARVLHGGFGSLPAGRRPQGRPGEHTL
jgi:hypothetical protein